VRKYPEKSGSVCVKTFSIKSSTLSVLIRCRAQPYRSEMSVSRNRSEGTSNMSQLSELVALRPSAKSRHKRNNNI